MIACNPLTQIKMLFMPPSIIPSPLAVIPPATGRDPSEGGRWSERDQSTGKLHLDLHKRAGLRADRPHRGHFAGRAQPLLLSLGSHQRGIAAGPLWRHRGTVHVPVLRRPITWLHDELQPPRTHFHHQHAQCEAPEGRKDPKDFYHSRPIVRHELRRGSIDSPG